MVVYDIGANGIGQGRRKSQRLIDDLREDETVLGLMHKIKAYLRCPIQQQILGQNFLSLVLKEAQRPST